MAKQPATTRAKQEQPTQPRDEEPRETPSASREIEILNPGQQNIPPGLAELTGEDSGKGLSTAPEDNIVPLIYILQSQSPQVLRQRAEYIEGACAGDIWLRNSGLPPAPGDTGIIVQPCAFSKDWVEWKPNRGGFVSRHADRPEDAKQVPDPKDPSRMVWERPNGNSVQETRYHYVLVSGRPFVIPMSSSAHTASRAWMALMNGFKGATGLSLPSWSRFYLLTTVPKHNDKGDWFGWQMEDLGWVNSPETYLAGRRLNADVVAGLRVADVDDEGQSVYEDNKASPI